MNESVVIVRQGEDFVIIDIPRVGTAVEIPEFGITIECQPVLSAGPKGKGRSVEKGTGRPEDKPKPPKSGTGKKRGRPKKVQPEDLPEEETEEEPFDEETPNGEPEIPEEEEDTLPIFPPGTPIQSEVIVPPAAPEVQEPGTRTP